MDFALCDGGCCTLVELLGVPRPILGLRPRDYGVGAYYHHQKLPNEVVDSPPTIRVRIQHGSHEIDLPIRKIGELKQ